MTVVFNMSVSINDKSSSIIYIYNESVDKMKMHTYQNIDITISNLHQINLNLQTRQNYL